MLFLQQRPSTGRAWVSALFALSMLLLGWHASAAVTTGIKVFAAQDALLSTGMKATNSSTLLSGTDTRLVVVSGTTTQDIAASIALQVTATGLSASAFKLECDTNDDFMGTADPVTYSSGISFPVFSGGSTCMPGTACVATQQDVTVTCTIAESTVLTLVNGDTVEFGIRLVPYAPETAKSVKLTCAPAADVDNSGLTIQNDSVEVPVAIAAVGVRILPGGGAVMAGRHPSRWTTGLTLSPTDKTQVVEYHDYGDGGLFKVALTANPPEPLTVTCHVDQEYSSMLADSTDASHFTKTFGVSAETTAQDVRLPAAGAVAAVQDVTFTCVATNAAGRVYSEASTTIALTPLAIRLVAGTSAFNDTTGLPVGAGQSIAGATLRATELQADSAGATLAVVLNGNPGASVTISCKSSDDTVVPTSAEVTFDSTDGLIAKDISIGTPPARANRGTATVECSLKTAVSGSGLEVKAENAADVASVTIAVEPLGVEIVAGGNAFDDATGSTITANTVVGDTKLRRVEAQADSTGNTLRVRLSGNPASDVTVECKSGTTAVLPDSETPGDYTLTFTNATEQGIKLGTVGDISSPSDVTITCTVTAADASSGFTVGSDQATATIRAVPLAVVIEAGTDATNASTGVKVDPDTVVSGNSGIILERIEGVADSAGGTIKVGLNGTLPGTSSVTITCTSGKTSDLPDVAGDDVGKNAATIAHDDAGPKDIMLGTVAAISAEDTVTVTCKVTSVSDAPDGPQMAVEESATVSVLVRPLQILILAGSSAVNAATGAEIAEDTVLTGTSTRLRRIEAQPDTAGATLKVKLNANPLQEVIVKCTSGTTGTHPDSGTDTHYTKTFTGVNGTTAQLITLGTLGIFESTPADVTITCEATADAGGLLTTDVATVAIAPSPLTVSIVAGTSAKDAVTGATVAPDTVVSGTSTKLERVEFQSDTAGGTVRLKLNGAVASGTELKMTCVSDEPTVLASPATTAVSFTGATISQSITLGTVQGGLTSDNDVVVRCTVDSDSGATGIATGTAVSFTVTARPLKILPVASSATLSPLGGSYSNGESVAGGILLLEDIADSGAGTRLQVKLSGNPGAGVTVECKSSDVAVLPDSAEADDYQAAFTTANGATAQSLKLGTVVTEPRDGDIVLFLSEGTAPWVAHDSDMAESGAVGVVGNDTIKLTVRNGSSGAKLTSGTTVTCTAYTDRELSVEASQAFGGTSSFSISTTVDLVKGATPDPEPTAEVRIQSVTTTTTLFVRCATGASDWTDVTMDFAMTIVPDVIPVAGSAAYENTPTGSQITAGVELSAGDSCKTPVVVEGVDSDSGALAELKFGRTVTSATINCTTSPEGVLPGHEGITVASSDKVGIDFGLAAAVTEPTVVTVTCTVAADPAPDGLTASTAVSFDVAVLPRTLHVVAGAGTPTRFSDMTSVPVGYELGVSTGSAPDYMHVVLPEGAANSTAVALKLSHVPVGSASVTIKCSTEQTDYFAENQSSFTVAANGLGPFAMTVPAAIKITQTTPVTFKCAAEADAGGYRSETTPQTVDFTVRFTPATMTPVAVSASVVNASLVPFEAGQSIATTSYNASLAVAVFEGDAETSSKIELRRTGAPGAETKATCTSSQEGVMPSFDITLTNASTAAPVTLPAPTGTTSTDVQYSCVPVDDLDVIGPSDTFGFSVRVIAFAVQAAAASNITLDDGTSLATGALIPAGARVVIHEGQLGTSSPISLKANITPGAATSYTCAGGSFENVTLSISSATAVQIRLVGPIPTAADATVSITCTPDGDIPATSKATAEDSVSFQVALKRLRVTPVRGSVLAAADGSTLGTREALATGDAAATPLVTEGRTVDDAVDFLPSARLPAAVEYACKSSDANLIADLDSVSLSSGATAPVSVDLVVAALAEEDAGGKTVTLECAPIIADGADPGAIAATDTFSFDVRVAPIVLHVVAGSGAVAEDGSDIPEDSILSAEDAPAAAIVTTSETSAGEVARLHLSATPSESVSIACSSSDAGVIADIDSVSVASDDPTPLTVPAPTEVSERTEVTFTCAPVAMTGGMSTADVATFRVVVLPRSVDVVASTQLVSAAGTPIAAGASVNASGDASLTPRLTAGTDPGAGGTVTIELNVESIETVTFDCSSSDPSILEDVTGITISTSRRTAQLDHPRVGAVDAPTVVGYSCSTVAPTPAEGEETETSTAPAMTVMYDVLVVPVTVSARAGTSAGTALAGNTLTEGAVISGVAVASRTVVVMEGAAAASTRVRLVPTAAPEVATLYDCASSDSSVIESIEGISLSAATGTNVPLPKVGDLRADTTVTFTCSPAPPATPAPTPEPSPTEPSEETPAEETPVPETPAPETPTPEPTEPPAPKTTVTGSVSFSVRVLALRPSVLAGSSARRADNNTSIEAGTNISGGASLALTPVVRAGEAHAAGAVASLALNGTPSASVTFKCTSSDELKMAHLESVVVSSTSPVPLELPAPNATLGDDATITYTCAPTETAGGVATDDSVKFDVRVHTPGLLALAGAHAFRTSTLLSIAENSGVGYYQAGAATLSLALPAETAIDSLVKFRAKVPVPPTGDEGSVDVTCSPSAGAPIDLFPVTAVKAASSGAVEVPASAPTTSDVKVTFTCTVECAGEHYDGTESVLLDVTVLARAVLPLIGSSAGVAADGATALIQGSRLATDTPAATPAVFELATTNLGGYVAFATTVSPIDESVTVDCSSNRADVLGPISGIVLGTDSSFMGGQAVPVTLPEPGAVDEDTLVTFTCAPRASAGGYTTGQVATFDVHVRKQRVAFQSGTRAVTPFPNTSDVAAVTAFEGTTYGSGELLSARALDRAVVVTCVLADTDGNDYGAVTSGGSALVSIPASGTAPLTLPTMPSGLSETLALAIACVPVGENPGYGEADVFSAAILVEPVASPQTPLPSTTPQARFRVGMRFDVQPTDAIVGGVRRQVRLTMASQLGVSDADVVVTNASRRSLLAVSGRLPTRIPSALS